MPSTVLTLFITGTDTGVGKTRVACALLRRARQAGLRAAGFKPVASGAERTADGLRNEDALALLTASEPGLSYDDVNPLCFEPPIAPHLAARATKQAIDLARLDEAHDRLARQHQLVIVEGAGGWQVPLDGALTFADWVSGRGWPVVLVVGLRLGCISHALLSAESIARRTRLAGWIANRLPPAMLARDENEADLRSLLPVPCWGALDEGALNFAEGENGFERWLRQADWP
jgi:dethiobiotin synthetase